MNTKEVLPMNANMDTGFKVSWTEIEIKHPQSFFGYANIFTSIVKFEYFTVMTGTSLCCFKYLCVQWMFYQLWVLPAQILESLLQLVQRAEAGRCPTPTPPLPPHVP